LRRENKPELHPLNPPSQVLALHSNNLCPALHVFRTECDYPIIQERINPAFVAGVRFPARVEFSGGA
jgi:hypothetical protein